VFAGRGQRWSTGGIDGNALGPQIVTDLERGAFTVRGEPSLAVLAARPGVFGFRVAK
jgi:hypothetical protein